MPKPEKLSLIKKKEKNVVRKTCEICNKKFASLKNYEKHEFFCRNKTIIDDGVNGFRKCESAFKNDFIIYEKHVNYQDLENMIIVEFSQLEEAFRKFLKIIGSMKIQFCLKITFYKFNEDGEVKLDTYMHSSQQQLTHSSQFEIFTEID